MEELTIYGEIMNAFLIFLTLHQPPAVNFYSWGPSETQGFLHPHKPLFRLKIITFRPPTHPIDSVNPSTVVLKREVSISC